MKFMCATGAKSMLPWRRSRKRAAFGVLLLLATLGVVGAGTWALVVGIESTDGKVGDFWALITSIQTRVAPPLPPLPRGSAARSPRPAQPSPALPL